MLSITDVIDLKTAVLKDARATRGEAVFLEVKPNIDIKQAISVVIADVARFMSKSTGKMYNSHREAYSDNYRIEEAGHPTYGLRVIKDLGKIYIQPIAVLEDTDILRRYVQRLRKISNDESRTYS
jgi:hypothetical protein